MKLDEVIISRAIIERFARKFSQDLDLDVAIVGTGECYFSAKKSPE